MSTTRSHRRRDPRTRRQGVLPAVGARLDRPRALVWAALAWVVLIFPLGQPAIEVKDYSTAVIYGIIALSLNILLGYVGQISLGHQSGAQDLRVDT